MKKKIPPENCKTGKINTQTHIYITAYFPGLVTGTSRKSTNDKLVWKPQTWFCIAFFGCCVYIWKYVATDFSKNNDVACSS